jgi:hypothetical protein
MRLAFYRGSLSDKWLDRLIAGNDAPRLYSHVEIAFDEYSVSGDLSMCFSSSWRDGGVRFKGIDLTDGKWDVVDVPAGPLDTVSVFRWCDPKVGGKYDVPGVLAFKVPFLRHVGAEWFCSEICTAALQQVGFFRGALPHKLSPNALYLLATRQFCPPTASGGAPCPH